MTNRQQESLIHNKIHLDTKRRLDKLKLNKNESDQDLIERIVTEVQEYKDVCLLMNRHKRLRHQEKILDKDKESKKYRKEFGRRSMFEIYLMDYILDYEMIQQFKQDPNFENEVKEFRNIGGKIIDQQDQLQARKDQDKLEKYGNMYNRKYHKDLK
jgi:urease gamma subunit